jgi:hypothetical protein
MELLRAAENTLELERLLERGLTASDRQISFLNMPRNSLDHTYVDSSQAWVRSAVGVKVMEDMRRNVPLFTFFSLFGQTLASLPEVLACARHFPTCAALTIRRHPAPSPFVAMSFLRLSEGVRHEFRLSMPAPVYEAVIQHEIRLRATEGRSLSGSTNPRWRRVLPASAPASSENAALVSKPCCR